MSKSKNIFTVVSSKERTEEKIKQIEEILSENWEVLNSLDGFKHTPILAICRPQAGRKNVELKLLEFILNQPEINVNAQSGRGMTALHFAVSKPDEQAVKLLLEHKNIDIYIKDNQGKTAFDECVDDPKLLELLNLFVSKEQNLIKLLKLEAKSKFLLFKIHQSKVNDQSEQKKNIEIIQSLLQDPDIDINQKNSENDPILLKLLNLFVGKEQSLIKLLKLEAKYKLLLFKICQPNVNDQSEQKKNLEIIQSLLQDPDIDVNHKNSKNDSLLIIAIKQKKFDIADLLINHERIDLDVKDQTGSTALGLVIDKIASEELIIDDQKYYELIKLMLDKGVKTNYLIKKDKTILKNSLILPKLIDAIKNNNWDEFKILIKENKFVPYEVADNEKCINIIEEMINKGELNIKDLDKQSKNIIIKKAAESNRTELINKFNSNFHSNNEYKIIKENIQNQQLKIQEINDDQKYSLAELAVQYNDLELLKNIIDTGYDLKLFLKDNVALLNIAAKKNYIPIFTLLLKQVINNVNDENLPDIFTENNREDLMLLKNNGANFQLNLLAEKLRDATKNGNLEAVKLFMDLDVSMEHDFQWESLNNWTVLHSAATLAHNGGGLKMFGLVIEKGIHLKEGIIGHPYFHEQGTGKVFNIGKAVDDIFLLKKPMLEIVNILHENIEELHRYESETKKINDKLPTIAAIDNDLTPEKKYAEYYNLIDGRFDVILTRISAVYAASIKLGLPLKDYICEYVSRLEKHVKTFNENNPSFRSNLKILLLNKLTELNFTIDDYNLNGQKLVKFSLKFLAAQHLTLDQETKEYLKSLEILSSVKKAQKIGTMLNSINKEALYDKEEESYKKAKKPDYHDNGIKYNNFIDSCFNRGYENFNPLKAILQSDNEDVVNFLIGDNNDSSSY